MSNQWERFLKNIKQKWLAITAAALLSLVVGSGSSAYQSEYQMHKTGLLTAEMRSQDWISTMPHDFRTLTQSQDRQSAIHERKLLPSAPLDSAAAGVWSGNFGPPGGYGDAYSLAVGSQGQIYVGGSFHSFGTSASNIAMWDGNNWSSLSSGVGSGFSTSVKALAIDAAGNLYAGGSFTSAGGVNANYIAKWDGFSWSALGSGMGGVDYPSVWALTFDNAGNLYAGGKFTTAGGEAANSIAMWDGTRWLPLGRGINGGSIRALAVDEHGNLYAGGYFTTAGGVAVNRIAKWDGYSWSALDSGMNNAVLALEADDLGNLYAGGRFTMAGAATASHIAKWDGSTWSALGSGLGSDHCQYWCTEVNSLVFDDDGNLYAGGIFFNAFGVSANQVAKWDESSWSALGSGMGGGYNNQDCPVTCVYTLAVDDADNLYAVGNFTTAGGQSAINVARWDRATWSALWSGAEKDNGMDGPINALARDVSGDLLAGGSFSRAGYPVINNLARWDGSNWNAVGSRGRVSSLTIDNSGVIYTADTYFSSRPFMAHTRIRRREMDGGGSSTLAGWDEEDNNEVTIHDLSVDDEGHLYAAGTFDTIEGVKAYYIAMWDGSSWFALGSGMNDTVYSLAVAENGDLYAGGRFTTAGEVNANYIAVWNGLKWSPLGSETNDYVQYLKFGMDEDLYVGGWFTTAGGVITNYIAKWDGSDWSALGSGMNSAVSAIAIGGDGTLFAGGSFTIAGGVNANYVASWDGVNWLPLESGIGGKLPTVNDLEVDSRGHLYVGGSFETAGGKTSANIAKWLNLPYAVLLPSIVR